MIQTQEQHDQQEAKLDFDILRKYRYYRAEVQRIFSDTSRRRRLEKLAGQTGIVIPKKIFKGI